MITDSAILDAIEDVSAGLVVPPDINAEAVLAAICGVETSWGERMHAGLFEPAYYRGGRYFKAPHVMKAVARYESLASCSFGPWQILFIAAIEFGYTGTPAGLIDPSVSAPLVVKYLNARCIKPASATDFADAWNSGTNRDAYVPSDYIAKFTPCYEEACAYYSATSRQARTTTT